MSSQEIVYNSRIQLNDLGSYPNYYMDISPISELLELFTLGRFGGTREHLQIFYNAAVGDQELSAVASDLADYLNFSAWNSFGVQQVKEGIEYRVYQIGSGFPRGFKVAIGKSFPSSGIFISGGRSEIRYNYPINIDEYHSGCVASLKSYQIALETSTGITKEIEYFNSDCS